MKFKNINKKTKGENFPSNSRTITECFNFSFSKFNSVKIFKAYSLILKLFVGLIFLVAVIAVGCDFQKNLQIKREIDFQRETLIRDFNFWKSFISKKQNYRDAYFQASILEYKLGNIYEAKMYLKKGLSLDPNSEDGKKLELFLANK